MHLNIKEHDDPTFLRISYQTWRKLGWLMVGLLAPEMLVYTAWYERNEAKKFAKVYNKHFHLTPSQGWFQKACRNALYRTTKRDLPQQNSQVDVEGKDISAAKERKRRPWGLAQGFCAQMGEFTLDTMGIYPQLIQEGKKTLDLFWFRKFLHLEDIEIGSSTQPNHYSAPQNQDEDAESRNADLTENEQDDRREQNTRNQSAGGQAQDVKMDADYRSLLELLDKSERDISDKSKASGLAKALVCLQAFWFCLQCLTRLAQSLPVTLLELNTFAHAICALLVYVLWWDKPLDVEQPTYIPIQGTKALYMWAMANIYASSDGIGRSEKPSSWFLSAFGLRRSGKNIAGSYQELKSAYLQLTDQHSEVIPR